MTGSVPVPAKGQPMKASWAAAVAERVNALCAMAPAGMLARDGAGGMGAQPLPQNLRDRRGGDAGRPMPFDLKAEIETSQDGTKQRLVVKYNPGKVIWLYEDRCTWNDDTPSTTIFTSDWGQLSDLSGLYAAFLNYKLTVSPQWDGALAPLSFAATTIWSKVSAEKQTAPSNAPATLPYGDAGLYYNLAPAQTLVGYILLGTVRVSNGVVTITQNFHGTLVLSDLLQINAGGGGGGGGGDDGGRAPGCWEIHTVELGPSQTATSWVNQYFMLGAELVEANVNDSPAAHTGKFVAVQVTEGASGMGISIQEYATAAAMAAASRDATKFTMPLGKLNAEGTGYEIDMRFIPHAGAWDAYIAPDSQSGSGGAS